MLVSRGIANTCIYTLAHTHTLSNLIFEIAGPLLERLKRIVRNTASLRIQHIYFWDEHFSFLYTVIYIYLYIHIFMLYIYIYIHIYIYI